MRTRLLAAGILLWAVTTAKGDTLIVLTPPVGEKAYSIAAEAFVDLWQKVTGTRPALKPWDDAAAARLPEGDLVQQFVGVAAAP